MLASTLTPRNVAYIASLAISAVVVSLFIVNGLLSEDQLSVMWVVGLFIVVFAASSFIIQIGIKRFIQDRVDQIHRTVHDLRSGKEEKIFELEMGSDVLGQISEDVQEWADEKQEEIQDLKEREKYRREFIGNLAHELKTPITSIQGYILTLLEGGLEDENVNREFLERASRGVDRLTDIVNDMDTITRLEGGIMVLEESNVDLREIVKETMSGLRMQAGKHSMTLKNEVAEGVNVYCDESRIEQVLTNLLNNAINYGKEGGTVTVGSYSVGDRVMVEVSDDGIGIEAAHLPRLFERFYRVGSSRSRHEGGSGLGLAIVKHILEAHGQAITVVSAPDEGTRFTFSLKKHQ